MRTARLRAGQLLTITASTTGKYWRLIDAGNLIMGSPVSVATGDSDIVGPFNENTSWSIGDGLTMVKSDYNYRSTSTTGWRDLILSVAGAAKAAAAPTLTNFGPSNSGAIKQLKFTVGDSVYVAGHIDHDYKAGSIAYPHAHWSTSGTDTNTVKWQFTCIQAFGHDQANFGTDTIITVEEAAAGTAWRHMITEDTVGIAGGLIEVDALWITEIKRISNGGTDNTDNVFLMFADLHYQVQQYATPSRTPDFYSGD